MDYIMNEPIPEEKIYDDECLCDICLTKGIINYNYDLSILTPYTEEIQIHILKKMEQLNFENERFQKTRREGKYNVNDYESIFDMPIYRGSDPNIFKKIIVNLSMKKYKHRDYLSRFETCYHCLEKFCCKKHKLFIFDNSEKYIINSGCCSETCYNIMYKYQYNNNSFYKDFNYKRYETIVKKNENQYICSGSYCNNLFEYDKRYTDFVSCSCEKCEPEREEIEGTIIIGTRECQKNEEWEPDIYDDGIFCSWKCWDNMHS